MADALLLILGAYLLGAIPSAYLAGRYLRGIDIRDYGSGNVGAGNLAAQMGNRTGLLLGAFDSLGKGALPVLLAKLFDQSLAVQVGVGLAAIVGHNWSPYIRFTGGRGAATAIGIVLGFFMWRELLVGAFIIGFLGRVVRGDSAFSAFIVMLVTPLLAYIWQPRTLAYGTAAMVLAIMIKRLTANWESPRAEIGLARVLAYRLLWDRDVPRQEEWTSRVPPSRTED